MFGDYAFGASYFGQGPGEFVAPIPPASVLCVTDLADDGQLVLTFAGAGLTTRGLGSSALSGQDLEITCGD
jgi:hypothetical protein